MNRGLKQGFPVAAILYLIDIEPLYLKITKTIKESRLRCEVLFTYGFIDDVIILLYNDYDFLNVHMILQKFESATNSVINRSKTKLLGYGTKGVNGA